MRDPKGRERTASGVGSAGYMEVTVAGGGATRARDFPCVDTVLTSAVMATDPSAPQGAA